MRFYALEKLINLGEGYRREFRIDSHRLLLLQIDGENYLIEALCPHQQHPLAAARLEGDSIHCPLHGYRFSLTSGQLLQASEAPCRALQVWPLVYEGSELGVFLEEGPGSSFGL
jgi:nitrite reductase/ring-hydroxylating ferredoxin subunit